MPNNQLNTESIRMGARTVNGNKYDHDNANLTLPADKVQSWSVSGAAQHPFHLHVYHMQAEGCGGDYEDGEYYDVLGANCNVRFDTNASTTTAYAGRTIMHCHILEHEDQGAMGWMNLTGGIGAPSFPADTPNPPFSDYYPARRRFGTQLWRRHLRRWRGQLQLFRGLWSPCLDRTHL